MLNNLVYVHCYLIKTISTFMCLKLDCFQQIDHQPIKCSRKEEKDNKILTAISLKSRHHSLIGFNHLSTKIKSFKDALRMQLNFLLRDGLRFSEILPIYSNISS